MGKAEVQPQPYAEAVRRGLEVNLDGTANILQTIVDGNFKVMLEHRDQPNVLSGPEQRALKISRRQLKSVIKILRTLERRMQRWPG